MVRCQCAVLQGIVYGPLNPGMLGFRAALCALQVSRTFWRQVWSERDVCYSLLFVGVSTVAMCVCADVDCGGNDGVKAVCPRCEINKKCNPVNDARGLPDCGVYKSTRYPDGTQLVCPGNTTNVPSWAERCRPRCEDGECSRHYSSLCAAPWRVDEPCQCSPVSAKVPIPQPLLCYYHFGFALPCSTCHSQAVSPCHSATEYHALLSL
jgi:hypothetical protein